MPQSTTRAAIYCRISSDRNHDNLGVERQEKACRQIARRKGWEVAAVFIDDDRSGFTGKFREGYGAMVESIKAGEVTAIVSWAPARLTRHPRELEDLIDLLDANRIDVATHVAGDYDLSTSGGRLTARVVGSVARHESEEKSERVKLKHQQIADAGGYHGGFRPYGYASDGVTIIEEEAEVIRLMARRIAEGVGLRRLQKELNDAGIPSATGRAWGISAMRGLLTNPRLAGLRTHQGQVIGEAVWTPILDRDTFDELQAILLDPRRKHARPARYLLTGLLYTVDGKKLTGKTVKRDTKGNLRRVYVAPGVNVNADDVERYLVEYVLTKTDEAALPNELVPKVPSKVTELERELDELAALRGEGAISLREWMAAKRPLDARLELARKQAPPPTRVPPGVSAALSRPGGLREDWPQMTEEGKRRALAQVLEKAIIHPVGPSGRFFDPDRVEPFLRH
jgi:DNA invertase Pin-like site-specific DNA recombinase